MARLIRSLLQVLSLVPMVFAGMFAVAAFHDLLSRPGNLLLALSAIMLRGIGR